MSLSLLLDGLKKFLFSRGHRISFLSRKGFFHWLPDEDFLKLQFRATMGEVLDLDNPQTFNAKLQWLKLYNRRPEYTMMVDKYEVKKYIAEKIGNEYVIPTLGVWEDPDDIDFNTLPNQFVLKCNHNSSVGLCICKDKSKLDIKKVKKALHKGLKQDCYMVAREWPYKDVKRKIICEKYMTDSTETNELTDYKFFCFNGKVDSVMICADRSTGHTKFYFYDKDWNLLRNYNQGSATAPEDFIYPKPLVMDKMFGIASELSKGHPHVRVDLYCCKGKIYFGELTFFSSSGFDANLSKYLDAHWGDLIHLPKQIIN